MARALKTSNIAYEHLIGVVPFIAHEGCKEKSHGNACDYRRPTDEAATDFPNVDFALVVPADPLLPGLEEETDAMQSDRAYKFMKWLMARPEREIVVSSHSAWLFNVLNTVEHEYLQETIRHANEMRNACKDKEQEYCQIKISDAWWEKLNALPFISSKCPSAPNPTFRDQGPHALAAQVGLAAGAAGAQAEEGPAHGDALPVPRGPPAAAAAGRGRHRHGAPAAPDALPLPEDAHAAEEEQARGRLSDS